MAQIAPTAPLPRALRDQLRRHRVTIARSPAAIPVVVAAVVPVRPPSRPWLWLSPRSPAEPRIRAAIAAGAYDVLAVSDPDVAARLAARAAELAIVDPMPAVPDGWIAASPAARATVAAIDRAARTSMPVLLTGETGTGKDLAARQLHTASARGDRPMISINCAAIPDELMEGELFGYVRGAFSGATHDYDGQFAAARGGTVFLDEIDHTPPTLQAKLLRVLEDRVVSRLGENTWRKLDFRIVAASNRDLPALAASGRFAADLFQRLAIVQIHVAPLRDRLDDLPALALAFIARYYGEEPASPHRVTRVAPRALDALARYPWPGNVRELRNVVFHALVGKRRGDELLVSDLPAHVIAAAPELAPTSIIDRLAIARRIERGEMNLRAARDELDRAALELALAHAGGRPAAAARALGEVGRGTSSDPGGTVRAMMRRYGVGSPA